MVNKPSWHISDFVLASYNFGCVEMSDSVPNNRSVDFLLSFEENGSWSASRAPKSLRSCNCEWNNVPRLVSALQRRSFRCWRPSAWRSAISHRRRRIGGIARWSQGMLSVVFSPVNNCFSGRKGRVFFISSWQVMKNGIITATQREESHEDCTVMLPRRRLGRIFTLRR